MVTQPQTTAERTAERIGDLILALRMWDDAYTTWHGLDPRLDAAARNGRRTLDNLPPITTTTIGEGP